MPPETFRVQGLEPAGTETEIEEEGDKPCSVALKTPCFASSASSSAALLELGKRHPLPGWVRYWQVVCFWKHG